MSEQLQAELAAMTKRALRAEDEIKRLAKRIHNQRVALRDNWEVVEMRRKWLGSDVARAGYIRLLKECRSLRERLAA